VNSSKFDIFGGNKNPIFSISKELKNHVHDEVSVFLIFKNKLVLNFHIIALTNFQ
jgi:hypothetical protein